MWELISTSWDSLNIFKMTCRSGSGGGYPIAIALQFIAVCCTRLLRRI